MPFDRESFSDNPEIYTQQPDVRLWAYTHGAEGGVGLEDPPVYGALGCFEERSPDELYEADLEFSPERRERKRERILAETSGRGHGSVLDQARFIFVAKNLPRTATLFLCQPQYGEHLQQSLRRASATRGVHLSPEITRSVHFDLVREAMIDAFDLYWRMTEAGIPAEDARIILPLGTRTNIQSSYDARELMHLHYMSRGEMVPSSARETVEAMMAAGRQVAPHLLAERAASYEPLAWYPAPQLYAESNPYLDELIAQYGGRDVTMVGYSEPVLPQGLFDQIAADVAVRDEAALSFLKHFHYTFLARMSLMTFHQAVRQRTWDQSVEPIYRAAARGEFVVPPSFARNPELLGQYNAQAASMLELYLRLIRDGVHPSEAVAVLPHSLVVYDLIHVNGWNAIHSVGKRTCTEAQWEIRRIAREMADYLHVRRRFLDRYSRPQGVVYGKCPEKNNCGACEALLRKIELRN